MANHTLVINKEGMNAVLSSPRVRFTWRAFGPRDQRSIDQQLRAGRHPCCPCCGECLEARPDTRLARMLPLDATGYDLDCRECRRFCSMVRHTFRSLRLIRMRHLVAAVRAVREPGGRRPAAQVA